MSSHDSAAIQYRVLQNICRSVGAEFSGISFRLACITTLPEFATSPTRECISYLSFYNILSYWTRGLVFWNNFITNSTDIYVLFVVLVNKLLASKAAGSLLNFIASLFPLNLCDNANRPYCRRRRYV